MPVDGQASELLEDVDDRGIGLTRWEVDFLDEMQKWVDDDKPLQPQQVRKIKQIHEDRVP